MQLGRHILSEGDIGVLLPHGCPLCGSKRWFRFDHSEIKYPLECNEDGEFASGDWYGRGKPVEEVNDPIEIDCQECYTVLWSDDEGWLNSMAEVLDES